MQDVFKFLFVLVFRIFLQGQLQSETRIFQYIGNVFRDRFAGIPMDGDQPAAQLVDFSGCPVSGLDFARGSQDQLFFRGFLLGLFFFGLFFAGVKSVGHRAVPLRGTVDACVRGGVTTAGSAPPSSRWRYFSTLRLCSASVPAKKCPPWVLATK